MTAARWYALLSLAWTIAAVAGCARPSESSCDPGAVRRVRDAAAGGAELTVCGHVTAVRRARETRSGLHQTFFVGTSSGDRIEVDANLDVLGRLPLRVNESAVVRGEYYHDADGRDGLHWTHRTDRGSHPPGYVILDGVRYQ